ncbi:MAG TPA: hypothetical protein VK846_11380 [Candidatus Limnocylindria bacterium]|nr:hypothetical protein [Candidatus Limnocylindria bacterium]
MKTNIPTVARPVEQLPEHDAVLEPKLRARCSATDAKARARLAEQLMQWAEQLRESVALMDLRLAAEMPTPKVPRGFFLVNMAQWRREKIEALAKECGYEMRAVIGWAVTKTWMELEDQIRVAQLMGVHPQDCRSFIHGEKQN